MDNVNDLVDQIMAYESGDMNADEEVDFFQRLIDSGAAWQLQGSYGSQAQAFIDAGLCHYAGNVRKANHA